MQRLLALLASLSVAACASVPAPGAPATRGANGLTAPPTSSTPVPFADDAEVRATFSPRVQEALLHGQLEVVLYEDGRRPLPDERAIRVQGGEKPVVAAAVVAEGEPRRHLLGALYGAVAAGGPVAGCFTPHHLVIAEHGTTRVELVVCFECHALRVVQDGEEIDGAIMSDDARPAFEALVGRTRGRTFEGRTLRQWMLALAKAGEARERGEIAAVPSEGVVILARLVGWGTGGQPSTALAVLRGLGPAAAPAVPLLAECLAGATKPYLRRELLDALAAIGGEAISALPAVEALTTDPEVGARARVTRAALSGESSVAIIGTQVAFGDSPRVLDAFPTDLQELLLDAELEVALLEPRLLRPGERAICGYPVVRSATLPDRAARGALLAKVYEGVDDAHGVVECFEPRHALVAQRGDRRVELLFSLQCLQLEVTSDGETGPRVATAPTASFAFEALLSGGR